MRKIIVCLLLSLVYTIVKAQTADSIIAPSIETVPFKKVVIEGGVTIPIGHLSNMMNVSPNVGFWYRIPKENNLIQNIGFSFNFPKKQSFDYMKDDYTTETKSFSGMLGVKMDKVFCINNQKQYNIEWSSLLGYGFYFYDDVRARAEYAQLPPDKKDKKETPAFIRPFSTIHLGQGIKINLNSFGVYARYNYAPYSLFTNIIDTDFGAHSVSVGLYYRQ